METIEQNATNASERVERLKNALQNAHPSVCPERALLWTAYFKKRENRKKPVVIKMAEALRHVLLEKTITVHPGELLVGNYTSKRVGGNIYPELHGIQVLMEIGGFPKRQVNPLSISRENIRKLRKILPFWLFRNIPARTYLSPVKSVPFLLSQFFPVNYLINELGGIAHFSPDYPSLLALGTEGIAALAQKRQKDFTKGSSEWHFCQAVQFTSETIALFSERYSDLALDLSLSEKDPQRKSELLEISDICRRVPRKPAENFREALQAILLTHIAVNVESIDVTISLGRMDQYLLPYYLADMAAGRLDRFKATELIGCFAVKLCETIPVFSKLVGLFHGGLPSFQTLVVGGMDKDGNDVSNELSYLFLDTLNGLKLRQPNFQARIHRDAAPDYLSKVYETLAHGGNSLAVYNDDVIVPTMTSYGYSLEDARNYIPIGCVEPGSQGKSFASTDAVLFNVPILVELALNRGRRFGSPLRSGAKTPPLSEMASMNDVTNAFEAQLSHMLSRMVTDLRRVEEANTRLKPTPLSSLLLDGCIENAKCSTAGGARYNFSGIQCVGPADAGDALYAIEKLVFKDRTFRLEHLVRILKKNIADPVALARMKKLSAFGNGDPDADHWTAFVIDRFTATLEGLGSNTRNGRYVTGLYSSTAHVYFGSKTGALPSGRRKGESFASGLAPSNGRDRNGTTALLNSMNSLDISKCLNGVNFNIKFQKESVSGTKGTDILKALLSPYFSRGGMQAQVNVLDRNTLIEAKRHPEKFPNLLVRVSGYSAYFGDLSESMQDEIIRRTENAG
jgi:formate C-acetyltransferase